MFLLCIPGRSFADGNLYEADAWPYGSCYAVAVDDFWSSEHRFAFLGSGGGIFKVEIFSDGTFDWSEDYDARTSGMVYQIAVFDGDGAIPDYLYVADGMGGVALVEKEKPQQGGQVPVHYLSLPGSMAGRVKVMSLCVVKYSVTGKTYLFAGTSERFDETGTCYLVCWELDPSDPTVPPTPPYPTWKAFSPSQGAHHHEVWAVRVYEHGGKLYAFLACDHAGGLRVVDVSDPADPSTWNVAAQEVPSEGNARDVVVYGDRVYLANDWKGVWIYDVTWTPSVSLGYVEAKGTRGYASDVEPFEHGGHAYLFVLNGFGLHDYTFEQLQQFANAPNIGPGSEPDPNWSSNPGLHLYKIEGAGMTHLSFMAVNRDDWDERIAMPPSDLVPFDVPDHTFVAVSQILWGLHNVEVVWSQTPPALEVPSEDHTFGKNPNGDVPVNTSDGLDVKEDGSELYLTCESTFHVLSPGTDTEPVMRLRYNDIGGVWATRWAPYVYTSGTSSKIKIVDPAADPPDLLRTVDIGKRTYGTYGIHFGEGDWLFTSSTCSNSTVGSLVHLELPDLAAVGHADGRGPGIDVWATDAGEAMEVYRSFNPRDVESQTEDRYAGVHKFAVAPQQGSSPFSYTEKGCRYLMDDLVPPGPPTRSMARIFRDEAGGGELYVCGVQGGLYVLDGGDGLSVLGRWWRDRYVQSPLPLCSVFLYTCRVARLNGVPYAVVSAFQRGLRPGGVYVLDVTNPAAPVEEAFCEVPGHPNDLRLQVDGVNGRLLIYLADGECGLRKLVFTPGTGGGS